MAAKFSLRFLCPSRAFAAAADSRSLDPELAAAQRRSAWRKLLLKLHWISSALCLLGMLLFSVTGITLNHAAQIEAKPQITRSTLPLPADLLPGLQGLAAAAPARLPPAVDAWLGANFHVDLSAASPEWSAEEIYLPLPRPGGDAWLRIGLEDGEVEYELTERGWISWLNDLHKGRHTGGVWSLFIDLFALACLFFSATGLLLLQMQAGQRPSTWPLVAFGCLLPALIALLFIH
ncbi:PepSY-associated TM helix domain-containing protein [Quatrionicoccus australiensis]|uniref:PepSY-associated TM helix domain-containing protein n=1 Tax=Quatrionicoccus australiensis TaxID=138118 RepID=UPI001CFC1CE1|nr:PepSY-associated TM helix domain-containing protein [Quatrionicoccus australiensis]MCB4360676.1 PepSY-associated TM helix domain-containing protein [Quatrionicoccus australiensis]